MSHLFDILKSFRGDIVIKLGGNHWLDKFGDKAQVSHRSVVPENMRWFLKLAGTTPGLVFTKGLRLSQVFGLNPVLNLRLLSQLSFVLKPYSQRVT